MKTALCLLLWLLVLLATAQRSLAQTNPSDGSVVQFGLKRMIHSKVLGEDRPYWVYLPSSHQGSVDRRYPAIYLLDGNAHFAWACEMVRFMSEINGNFQIPEAIVVAIPNTRDNRTRDFTPTHSTKSYDGKDDLSCASSGGGISFEAFIERELVPKIEVDYRTTPYRILVGHSLGGLLVLDKFLRQPSVFQAYIAIDPSVWWDNYFLLRRTKEILSGVMNPRQQVYVTVANNPPAEGFDPKPIESASRRFVEMLQTNAPAFRCRFDYFQSENHNSVPMLSLYHGLLFVFDGYKPPAVFEKRTALQAHFKAVSKRLGCEFPPPEDFVNANGHYLLEQKSDPDKAIEVFNLNAKNYPKSADVYESLGKAYLAKGEKSLAITNFERAIALDPKIQSAIDALKKLK